MVDCDICGEHFARRDNLSRHKKRRYPCDGSKTRTTVASSSSSSSKRLSNEEHTNVPPPKKMESETLIPLLSKTHKLSLDNAESGDVLQDIEGPVTDIPTFDGAEFSGEKPKSDETLLKIMKMLKIPHQRHARILKEEREADNQPPPEKSNGLHPNCSDKVMKDIDSSEGESMDESGSDESGVDMKENSESDEVDGKDMEKLEDEEETPLDDAAIRNLIKRFKILHHQLIHEGRKEHVYLLS